MSEFVQHIPCPACDSSDANAEYSDGSTYCFSCKARSGGAAEDRAEGVPDLHPEPFNMESRKLSASTLRHFGYGAVSWKGTTVQAATLHKVNGQVVGFKLRLPGKQFLKLGQHKDAEPLWAQHLWRDSGRRVVITEGEIDAMSISQIQDNKWPVVSLPDGADSAVKAIKASMDWLSKFDEVVLAFDMDDVGREAALKAAALFKPGTAKIASFPAPYKDANDMLKAGANKALYDCLWAAKVFRPDGIVSGADIIQHLERKIPEGTAWPFIGLQAKTRGIRPGEIVTICAGSGVGKSSLVRETGAFLAKQGIKVGHIGLEESVQISALGYLSVLTDRPLRLEAEPMLVPGVAAALPVVTENVSFYDHFGSVGEDDLLNRIRYMITALDCKVIILDHLSIVVSGMEGNDERRSIDNLMTKLRSLTEETRVGLLLVSHLRRRGSNSPGFEMGVEPRMSDLRGSAGIEQMSDMIVGASRNLMTDDTDERSVVHMAVLKNRWTGETGSAGTLRYDNDTGRLSDYDYVPSGGFTTEEAY